VCRFDTSSSARSSKERLAQRPGTARDVAAHVVRIVAFTVGRRRRDPREDQVTKSRRESFYLVLDALGHVDVRAVRHVTVRPQRVLTNGRTSVVDHARLNDDANGFSG